MSSTRQRTVLMAIFFFATATMLMGSARAGSFTDDIPLWMAESLGITVAVAKLILSVAILASIGGVLSISKHSSPFLTIVVMLGAVGMLTAITWLDYWLLMFVALMIAIMFGAKLRDWAKGAVE